MSWLVPQRRLMAGALVLTGLALPSFAITSSPTETANPEDVEEVVVSAERLPVPSLIEMRDTYKAQGQA